MSFLDKLKGLFGGKKEEPSLYAALEKQVDALENKLLISEQQKRIEGGIDGFDMAYEETRQMLQGYSGEGAGQEALQMLRTRMTLAHKVAHLLREEDPAKKRRLCQEFVAEFRPLRDTLHYRTKTKYERIRIDFESGRLGGVSKT